MKLCKFCNKQLTKRHFCANQYCYENVLLQFFINIMLDYNPDNSLDFFCLCMKRINQNDIFQESSNISEVVRYNLNIFLCDYDCF